MDLHHLKIFVSVFKHRSFSKASRELCLTQPTVSDHIQTLERELKCKLFDRLGRTILPTKEAEILNLYSAEVIEKAEALKEALGNLHKEIEGEIVLGASTIPGTYLIPSLLASFLKKYPSVSFKVLISDSRGIIEKVNQHELLIGIVGSEIRSPQIDSIPLMEDELIVVASPSLVQKATVSLQDLPRYPVILREEGSGTLRETERILEKEGISLEAFKVAGVFGSTDAVKQGVKAGLGISILSRMSVIEDLKQGTLREIKIRSLQMKRRFFLVTHKKRALPPATHAFLEHVLADMKPSSR
jgi:DNA-binding transcriptional LysR family regulator